MDARGRLAQWTMTGETDRSLISQSPIVLAALITMSTVSPVPTNSSNSKTIKNHLRLNTCQAIQAVVKLESSKPLIVDPDGQLLTAPAPHSSTCPKFQEAHHKISTITLNPTMNLGDSQQTDPHLAYILDMKKLPKPNSQVLSCSCLN
jgi:hypothetical protein